MKKSITLATLSLMTCASFGYSANSSVAASSWQTQAPAQNAPIMPQTNQMGGGVQDVNSNSFQDALAATDRPIILIFSASWCRPCQNMKPFTEEIARETPQATFLRVDFDASPDLVQSYNITSIPAILFIRPDGMIVDRVIGFSEKQQLKGRVQAFLQSMR